MINNKKAEDLKAEVESQKAEQSSENLENYDQVKNDLIKDVKSSAEAFQAEDHIIEDITCQTDSDIVAEVKTEINLDAELIELNTQAQNLEQETLEKIESNNFDIEKLANDYNLSPVSRKAFKEFIQVVSEDNEIHSCRLQFRVENLPDDILRSPEVRLLIENKFVEVLTGEGGENVHVGQLSDHVKMFGLSEVFLADKRFDTYRQKFWLQRISKGEKIDFATGLKIDDYSFHDEESESLNVLLEGNFNEVSKLINKQELFQAGIEGMMNLANKSAWSNVISSAKQEESLVSYQTNLKISDDQFCEMAIPMLKANLLEYNFSPEFLNKYTKIADFLNSKETKDLAKSEISKVATASYRVERALPYYNLGKEDLNQDQIVASFKQDSASFFKDSISSLDGVMQYLDDNHFKMIREEFCNLDKNIQEDFIKRNFTFIGSPYFSEYNDILIRLNLPQDVLLSAAQNIIADKLLTDSYSSSYYDDNKLAFDFCGLNEETKDEALSMGLCQQFIRYEGQFGASDYYMERIGLKSFIFTPKVEAVIKNGYIEAIKTGRVGTLEHINNFLDTNNKSLNWEPQEMITIKESFASGIPAVCCQGKTNLDLLIKKYYPERHKVFLIANSEIKASVLNKLVDTLCNSEYNTKNINEAIDYFSLDRTKLVAAVDQNIKFINSQTIESFNKIIPELDVEAHNDKWIDNNSEVAINLALEERNFEFLRSLSKHPKTAEAFAEVLREQEYNYLNNISSSLTNYSEEFISDFFDQSSFSEGLEVQERRVIFNLNSAQQSVALRKVAELSSEKRSGYISILKRASDCPSQEMKRIKDEIIDEIVKSDNPYKAYEVIESVFVENNIPLVGKVSKIFNYLHSDQKIEADLNKSHGSPVLKNQTADGRREVIHRDLGKIHVESGNRSLKKYLQIFQAAEPVFDKMSAGDWQDLSQSELDIFNNALKKLKTIKDNSLGINNETKTLDTSEDFLKLFEDLKNDIGLKDNQNISDRVLELLLGKSYGGISEALAAMNQVKGLASNRNQELAKNIINKEPLIANSDLLKGVGLQYLSNILQNGSVAKEFLGGAADEDSTPLDTDVLMINESDAALNFKDLISNSKVNDYGEVVLVLKNRGQYQNSTDDKNASFDTEKFELFKTGAIDRDKHYGVRTGLPSTQIDAIVIKEEKLKQRVAFEIAKNGFYIPIVNRAGDLIFSPAEYDKIREVFAGVDEYEGTNLKIEKLADNDKLKPLLENIKNKKAESDLETKLIGNALKGAVFNILRQQNIKFKNRMESGIFGAELHDTGSTSRLTNMPDDFDFDLAIRLDNNDIAKAGDYANALLKVVKAHEAVVEYHSDGYYQFRAKKLFKIGDLEIPQGIDLDIGFGRKTDDVVYGSHDAVADKLKSITNTYGEDYNQEVRANIVLAKQILSEAGCYKKLDNGLGGIGVENWLLQHNGNLREALESFKKAAINKDGSRRILEEFKDIYSVYDAGTNIKFNNHDNFMYKLNDKTYQKMLSLANELS